MLVLSRKVGESICIGDGIEVVVLKTCGNYVRLGFVAPDEVTIHRKEVRLRIEEELRTDRESHHAVLVKAGDAYE